MVGIIPGHSAQRSDQNRLIRSRRAPTHGSPSVCLCYKKIAVIPCQSHAHAWVSGWCALSDRMRPCAARYRIGSGAALRVLGSDSFSRYRYRIGARIGSDSTSDAGAWQREGLCLFLVCFSFLPTKETNTTAPVSVPVSGLFLVCFWPVSGLFLIFVAIFGNSGLFLHILSIFGNPHSFRASGLFLACFWCLFLACSRPVPGLFLPVSACFWFVSFVASGVCFLLPPPSGTAIATRATIGLLHRHIHPLSSYVPPRSPGAQSLGSVK